MTGGTFGVYEVPFRALKKKTTEPVVWCDHDFRSRLYQISIGWRSPDRPKSQEDDGCAALMKHTFHGDFGSGSKCSSVHTFHSLYCPKHFIKIQHFPYGSETTARFSLNIPFYTYNARRRYNTSLNLHDLGHRWSTRSVTRRAADHTLAA